MWHSVRNYLDAYDEHAAELRKNPNDPVAAMMLQKLDPGRRKLLWAVKERTTRFAEYLLATGMAPTTFTKVAAELIGDTKRWQTHSQMIGWQVAKEIGLEVQNLDPTNDEWRLFWRLYCLQRLSLGEERGKLFESEHVSLCPGISKLV